jgi:hypothetical protein
MKDPMTPPVPMMANELENLEKLREYMSETEFEQYLEKRAIEALIKYRATSDLEALEEMQFFMHRITHEIILGLKKSGEAQTLQDQIKRLNTLAEMHEGRDGMV